MTTDRVALLPELVVEVESARLNSFFGEMPVYWASYRGVPCCRNVSLERRHAHRDEAISHGRHLVVTGVWKTDA